MSRLQSVLRHVSAAALCVIAGSASAQVQTPLPGSFIPQFVDPLPDLDLSGGPIKTVVAGASEIEVHMREFQSKVMPSTFVPLTGTYTGTWVWGYIVGPTPPVGVQDTFTGPIVVATRGVPTQMRFVNNLGHTSTTNVHFWRNGTDQTLHWADPNHDAMNHCAHEGHMNPGLPPVGECAENYVGSIPACVHMHGAEVPPVIDGSPDSWMTADGLHHGPAYYTMPGVPVAGNEAVYRYPNTQQAAPLWFHDHLLGGTRLNVYAGLAGAYPLIDPALALPTGLHPIGLQQGKTGPVDLLVPLVIQDRQFDEQGQLYFPNEGINPEHPFWVPEFLGDTILVNGKVWPYLDVQPKRYRFFIINGSNARVYSMALENETTGAPGPSIWQIGTDGGYLDNPVEIDPALGERLVTMTGERAEIIIDFSDFAGQTLILSNTAGAPYPDGDPVDPATTGRIMQFRVSSAGVADASYNPAKGTPIRTGNQKIVRLTDPNTGTMVPKVKVHKTRQLTLNEVMGPGGPLEILVNNTLWGGTNRPDFTPVVQGGMTTYYSETPTEGTTEIWEIVNLTMDAHPIHTHLTTFQLLNRQAFDLASYEVDYEMAFPGGMHMGGYGPPLDYNTGNPRALGGNPDITPYLVGPAFPPFANEAGWKDTVMMMPGEVTRIAVRYTPQDYPALITTPLPRSVVPSYPFDPGAGGAGYVWHCHIIDHEDNEMMRPYLVIPRFRAPRSYRFGIDY